MSIGKKTKIYLIVLLIVSGLLISYICINSSNGWIMIKINNKIYVANSLEKYKQIEGKQIAATQYKQLPFIKPTRNNGSNKLPYGQFLYEGENEDEIFLENNDYFIKLISIDTDNWKDGVKVTLEDL